MGWEILEMGVLLEKTFIFMGRNLKGSVVVKAGNRLFGRRV